MKRRRIRIMTFGAFLLALGKTCLRMGGLEKVRRKHPRRRVNHLMRYSDAECRDSMFSCQGIANLYNLSENGLQFHSYQPTAIHALLKIEIYLKSENIVIPLIGETMWTETVAIGKSFHYKVGVAIHEIDEKYKDLLRMICSENSSLAA